MPFKSYAEESRKNWGDEKGESLSLEQINCGATLRIANAVEAMAKNHNTLIADLENNKRWLNQKRAECERLARSNAALRGYISRLKKEKP